MRQTTAPEVRLPDASSLALEAVLTSVLAHFLKADSEVRSVIAWAFEDASQKLEQAASAAGFPDEKARIAAAIELVDQMRQSVLSVSEHDRAANPD